MPGTHNHDWDARENTERVVRIDRFRAPNVDDDKCWRMLAEHENGRLDAARRADMEAAAHQQYV
jgi:hypothetical protein